MRVKSSECHCHQSKNLYPCPGRSFEMAGMVEKLAVAYLKKAEGGEK